MPSRPPLVVSQNDFDSIFALIRNLRTEAAELLEEELGRATVVSLEQLPEDVVAMNTVVSFKDVDSGKESTITLVYPHEANIEEGKVSILAPVGSALIGLRIGESIRWPLPNGKDRNLKVTSVAVR